MVATMPLRQLSSMRAQYLAQAGLGNAIKINYDFEKRDRTIEKCGNFQEIVLWFEHDLYDQLQVLQVLNFFSDKEMEPGRVQLIMSGVYLGIQTADDLLEMLPRRKPVSGATYAQATGMWMAFGSDDPVRWLELSGRSNELPYLRTAVERLVQEFPSVANGLSRTEQQALETVARGAMRKEDIFAACQSQEEAPFLGDTTFYMKLQVLCDPIAPLIAEVASRFSITPLGLKVLRCETDWLESHRLERWIGGVHLTNRNAWRWDGARAALLR